MVDIKGLNKAEVFISPLRNNNPIIIDYIKGVSGGLATGQKVCVIAYTGNSGVVAGQIYKDAYQALKLGNTIPLSGTDFSIRLSDVDSLTREDLLNHQTIFKVILKGELV